MVAKPPATKPVRATPEDREINRKRILRSLDTSADRIERVITAARKRRQIQRDAGDNIGAAASLNLIDRARRVENTILRTKIRVIDNSDEVKKLIGKFKAVNKDLKAASEELTSLANDLKSVAKLIGVLEKIIAKVATTGIA